MLMHGYWHDFTVMILKCKEVMKIYRDHPSGLKPYCFILLYYFILHNNCEELYVVRHKSIHSSKSAINFDLDTEVIKQNCDFVFYFNKSDITLTVLDDGN